LFEAEWVWRDPLPAKSRSGDSELVWAKVTTKPELLEWEEAWWGDARNERVVRTRQFPGQLLTNPDCGFFAGRLHGQIVAGGIANRSPGVVGISNVFSPRTFSEDSWDALVMSISTMFPNTPLVGYERGADLLLAERVGFVPIGALRVWSRST
jgi:hypothetical protein